MLSFALEYREAIDRLTADRVADIRKLEVDDEEWELLKQLRDVLKVSTVTSSHQVTVLRRLQRDAWPSLFALDHSFAHAYTLGVLRCDPLRLPQRLAQLTHGYPRHGPHG